jgi:hypothetical protein
MGKLNPKRSFCHSRRHTHARIHLLKADMGEQDDLVYAHSDQVVDVLLRRRDLIEQSCSHILPSASSTHPSRIGTVLCMLLGRDANDADLSGLGFQV